MKSNRQYSCIYNVYPRGSGGRGFPAVGELTAGTLAGLKEKAVRLRDEQRGSADQICFSRVSRTTVFEYQQAPCQPFILKDNER